MFKLWFFLKPLQKKSLYDVEKCQVQQKNFHLLPFKTMSCHHGENAKHQISNIT